MKKVLLTLAVVAGAMFAQADSYLYWMLDETPSTSADGYNPKPSFDDYAVRVFDVNGKKYLTFGNSDETFAAAQSGINYQSLLSDPTATSFIIELWNDPGATEAAYAYYPTYSDIAAYIRPSSEHEIAGKLIAASRFTAVPEPTSGMMLLVGAMLLGLKRKKLA